MIEFTAAVVSCIAAAISATGGIYVAYDRYTERQPFAVISQLSLAVSNPRRRAIHIRKICFSGAPIKAFSEHSHGVPVYTMQNGYSFEVDTIVHGGQAEFINPFVEFSTEQKYSLSMKKTKENGNVFIVYVNVT